MAQTPQQLKAIAKRILLREATVVEEVRLEILTSAKSDWTKESLTKAFAQTLNVTEETSQSRLRSHNDSDRLVDELVNELNKKR